MSLFYLLLGLMVLGFGAIAFVITMEKMQASSPKDMNKNDTKGQTSPRDLLNRLGLEKTTPAEAPAKKNLSMGLFKKASPTQEPPDSTPLLADPLKSSFPITQFTSMPNDTKTESELSLKHDELLTHHQELQEKFTKLEALFTEKSSDLEKIEKTLTNELKNQKDFHKTKDILEKEIRESKDKIKDLQGEVATAQTETQTHIKRITQLEEKVKQLEVEVLTSEAAINDGQAGIQLARKHATGLEEKLRAQENLILEKNQKIEDLVARLNIPSTTNALPPTETISDQELNPDPRTSNQQQTVIIEASPELPPEPMPTETPEIKSTPETESELNSQPQASPDTSNTETLSLPADIFANPQQETPPTLPPDEKLPKNDKPEPPTELST